MPLTNQQNSHNWQYQRQIQFYQQQQHNLQHYRHQPPPSQNGFMPVGCLEQSATFLYLRPPIYCQSQAEMSGEAEEEQVKDEGGGYDFCQRSQSEEDVALYQQSFHDHHNQLYNHVHRHHHHHNHNDNNNNHDRFKNVFIDINNHQMTPKSMSTPPPSAAFGYEIAAVAVMAPSEQLKSSSVPIQKRILNEFKLQQQKELVLRRQSSQARSGSVNQKSSGSSSSSNFETGK